MKSFWFYMFTSDGRGNYAWPKGLHYSMPFKCTAPEGVLGIFDKKQAQGPFDSYKEAFNILDAVMDSHTEAGDKLYTHRSDC